MTGFSPTVVPAKTGTGDRPPARERLALLARLHDRAGRSFAARCVLFLGTVLILLGLFAALEWPHLGYNARLHWDAETAITNDVTTPRREALQEARDHIFDIVTVTGTTDPAKATILFNAGDPRFTHKAIETVRLYYSQVSFAVAKIIYDAVGRRTGSPVDAVLAFQLSAILAVSVSLAMLLTYCVVTTPAGPELAVRLRMLALAAAAAASCPIFLSIARQLLTETVAFFWFIPAVMLLVWAVNPRRSTAVAACTAAAAAAGLLLTLRTRYSMGPAIALLVPVVLMAAVPSASLRSRWRHYTVCGFAATATVALLVAVDVRFYGPLIYPWVYNDVMVRSTRLFFHDFPPYNMFFVMLYNNSAMVLLPTGAIAAFAWRAPVFGDSIPRAQQVWLRNCSITAFAVLLLLIAMTARQQVGFQGRHLFTLSGACTVLMLLSIGRTDWTAAGRRWFSGACLFFLAFNLLSTYWMQRTDPLGYGHRLFQPSVVMRLRQSHPPLGIALRGVAAYYEGADVPRIHDGLIAAEYIHEHQLPGKKAVLITDPSPDDGRWWAGHFAVQFQLADVLSMGARFDPAVIAPVRAALEARRPVYLSTASRRPVCPLFQTEPVDTEPFDSAALYRVTGVADAGFLAASSPYPSATPDGIKITATRGAVHRFDINAWWLIAEISCEDISAYTDPAAVEFSIEGLHPGRPCQVSIVAWDPLKTGRILSVEMPDKSPVPVPLTGFPAVTTIQMQLSSAGPCRIRITAQHGAPVDVCEIWVRQK